MGPTSFDSYGDIARLEQLLDEHYQCTTLDPAKLPLLGGQIWELVRQADLDRDLGVQERPDNFPGFLLHIDGYLCELKDAQIRDGLHTLGQVPGGEQMVGLLSSLTRLDTGNAPSRRRAMAEALGLDYAGLLAEPGRPLETPQPPHLYRIFGSKPGTYGAGILPVLDERNWETVQDLAEVYTAWGGYAYTRQEFGVHARDEFRRRFSQIVVAAKNQDNREHDIFESDDYMQYYRGMIATVRALTGRNPQQFFGDSSDPSRARVRKLEESTLEIIKELTGDESVTWVFGGGGVVSENTSKGIREPEVSNGYATIEADNWHFHVKLDDVTGIQFVEAESHGDLISYYVRFSNDKEETLLRGYFPNPYLDDDYQRAEFQHGKFQRFAEMRGRYVGSEGIVFVKHPRS